MSAILFQLFAKCDAVRWVYDPTSYIFIWVLKQQSREITRDTVLHEYSVVVALQIFKGKGGEES
jgi:hypothetical protein